MDETPSRSRVHIRERGGHFYLLSVSVSLPSVSLILIENSTLLHRINLVTICPPETSGVSVLQMHFSPPFFELHLTLSPQVIAAWVQVVAQAGGSIALAIQAGLNGGDVVEWKTDAKGYWFLLGGVCAAQFVVFYKPPHVFK